MQEPGLLDTEAAFSRGPLGEKLYEITRIFAFGGGLGFIALVVMSLISIVGRKLVSMPIPGDIEVMQMGTAVASAAMLAYCEMERHHLRVDFSPLLYRLKRVNYLIRFLIYCWGWWPL